MGLPPSDGDKKGLLLQRVPESAFQLFQLQSCVFTPSQHKTDRGEWWYYLMDEPRARCPGEPDTLHSRGWTPTVVWRVQLQEIAQPGCQGLGYAANHRKPGERHRTDYLSRHLGLGLGRDWRTQQRAPVGSPPRLPSPGIKWH